ncbi:MAG: hypothetical protein J6L00_03225 [Clostridia bacterium]|nr:hypothetical protein [Clostridia bacterium]
MKLCKKLLALSLVAVMLFSFAACGSTPKVAMTVDGKDYATGEYLAYMLDAFQQVYVNGGLYYYAQQNVDVWAQEYTYNEQKVKLEEYIKKMTVDTIIRQKTLENMMEKAGVKPSEESTKDVEEMLKAVSESTLLSYGVGMENYKKMCEAYYRNEISLFMSRYDKDGTTPVPEADIRKYFDENYLSYKMISVEMMTADNKEMSEDEQKKVTDNLQKYLDMYNKGTDFNKVIAQYNYDISTSSDKKLETLTDKDTRQDIEVKAANDTQFTDAIKSVKEGEAKLVTYKAGGSTLTAAVILRLDPEKGEGYENAFTENRQNILLGIKFEEFDKEVDEEAKKLTYTVNERAYKMCSPKEFVK